MKHGREEIGVDDVVENTAEDVTEDAAENVVSVLDAVEDD